MPSRRRDTRAEKKHNTSDDVIRCDKVTSLEAYLAHLGRAENHQEKSASGSRWAFKFRFGFSDLLERPEIRWGATMHI